MMIFIIFKHFLLNFNRVKLAFHILDCGGNFLLYYEQLLLFYTWEKKRQKMSKTYVCDRS